MNCLSVLFAIVDTEFSVYEKICNNEVRTLATKFDFITYKLYTSKDTF